ncbi:MAG: DUF5698 domain-containing protein [Erysipelotrichales bacterium]|nr:DUF5698 domain-containing protein [Erysipelotrichales bacterium]
MGLEILIWGIIVFFARITDVTMGTMRTICMVNEKKYIGTMIGFVEVMIFFLVIRTLLGNPMSDKIFIVICFAAGFGVGRALGVYISERFLKNPVEIRIITRDVKPVLPAILRNADFGLTIVNSRGIDNRKSRILFIYSQARYVKEVTELVYKYDDKAFITINPTREYMAADIKEE